MGTDIGARPYDVRFTPKSGHQLRAVVCPLCAISGHSPRVPSPLWGSLAGNDRVDEHAADRGRHGAALLGSNRLKLVADRSKLNVCKLSRG
jgi:hypothetical protein